MSSSIDSLILHRPAEVIEQLGPISYRDTWLGKRKHKRLDVVLPVRLYPLGEYGKPHGAAFTARSRDISVDGLGTIVRYDLEICQQFKVELFTELGALVGRMRTMHSTQTIGGFKIGMQWMGPLAERVTPPRFEDCRLISPASSKKSASDIMTVEQAREEIRQSIHKYFVATVSRGLLGISMEKEIARLIGTLPTPPDDGVQFGPRRRSPRYGVQGKVHLVIPAGEIQELSNHEIVDISSTGARIAVSTEAPAPSTGEESQPVFDWSRLERDKAVVIGLWVESRGTLWLPARVVHCTPSLAQPSSVGLQFSKDNVLREFR